MSQYASGVDEEGVLQIDVIVRGEVPDLSNGMELTLTPYYENYIQTGQGERTPALILISQTGKFAAPQLHVFLDSSTSASEMVISTKKMSTFTSDMSTSTIEMSTLLSLY